MSTLKFTPSNRRAFLGKVTGAAALVGASSLITPAHAKELTEHTDVVGDPDEWFKGLRGKHRLVFDVTGPKSIFPFAWPKVFMMTNIASGVSDRDVSCVVVFRHDAYCYALQDRLWAKYKLGELQKVDDPQTKTFALRNPFWKPKSDDFSAPGLGVVQLGIPELQESGIMFCTCDIALTVFSAVIAGNTSQQPADVKKEFLEGLVPGIPAMPSGIWAIGRAQEHGCGYCNV